MSKKCRIQKNACKICLQSVSKRTGIQCEGACKKWVHYDCLDFTPGKVRDIKKGYIKVMCPCPDCSTEPKEILVNPPFTCKNQNCPANNAPKCTSLSCPINNPTPCEKNTCTKNSDLIDKPYHVPNQVNMPKKKTCEKPKSSQGSLPSSYKRNCSATCCSPSSTAGSCSFSKMPSMSDSQMVGSQRGCNQSMVTALEQMCNTVGELSCQIRELMLKILDKTRS